MGIQMIYDHWQFDVWRDKPRLTLMSCVYISQLYCRTQD